MSRRQGRLASLEASDSKDAAQLSTMIWLHRLTVSFLADVRAGVVGHHVADRNPAAPLTTVLVALLISSIPAVLIALPLTVSGDAGRQVHRWQ